MHVKHDFRSNCKTKLCTWGDLMRQPGCYCADLWYSCCRSRWPSNFAGGMAGSLFK
jgi:hypothetical protein